MKELTLEQLRETVAVYQPLLGLQPWLLTVDMADELCNDADLAKVSINSRRARAAILLSRQCPDQEASLIHELLETAFVPLGEMFDGLQPNEAQERQWNHILHRLMYRLASAILKREVEVP